MPLKYVPGIGSVAAKIMIVGEAPGKVESETGIPFSGPTGEMLNEMLSNAGIRRSECYITNVVKYRPPQNDFKKLHLIDVDLQQSIEKLWVEEINQLKPNVILAVGNEALKALTGNDGILKYRGSILAATDGVRKVVPTVHPAALFTRSAENSPDEETHGALSYVYKKLIQLDILRAKEESASPSIDLPVRDTVIARNSLDVHRFFQEYKSLRRGSADIESINCIPVCIAIAFNTHHSLTIPLIRKVGPHYLTDMSSREIIECWDLVQSCFISHEWVGQNFKYDEFKLDLFGFDFSKVVLASDTLLKTHLVFPELPDKRLNTQTSIWTREPYYKDDGKEPKLGKKFNVEKFFKYNGKDALVTLEIDQAQELHLEELSEQFKVDLKSFYYNFVMKAHKFYLHLERHGFDVDLERKKELKKNYEKMAEEVHNRQTERIGYELNVKSVPQVFRFLYEDMKFPKRFRDPTSEDTIVALLGSHCKGEKAEIKRKALQDILEERRIRDELGRAINFTPDYDGKCRCSFKITGTETARRSTNILKPPMRPKKMGLAFHTIPKHGRLAKDIRSMLVPREGYVFIQGDLSQAEARIVAVLAEDYELLEAFDRVDIHRRTAALFFGLSKTLNLSPTFIPVIDDMEKDGPMRFTGKTFRHAGNYDMGKRRAMTEFNTSAQKFEIPMSISEYKAGQMLELFHFASPKIKNVFHKGIRDAIDNSRALVTPYGRPRLFYERAGEELYKEGYAHIPQCTVADTTLAAALACFEEFDENIAFFTSENHDSLLIQAPANNWEPYAKALKRHMTRPINFNEHCSLRRDYILTIPVDIEVSETNFAELKKVKFEGVAA